MSDAPNNERRWMCRWLFATDAVACTPDHRHKGFGCGYVDAAPVPSPVPSRPDTAELRELAYGYDYFSPEPSDEGVLIHAAADWIDAQPAADQGPDLSEAAALLDEYDQSVHNLTRFGTVAAQTDHLLASERIAAFVRRLLDREGGA